LDVKLLAGADGMFTLFESMVKQIKNGISERTVMGWINEETGSVAAVFFCSADSLQKVILTLILKTNQTLS